MVNILDTLKILNRFLKWKVLSNFNKTYFLINTVWQWIQSQCTCVKNGYIRENRMSILSLARHIQGVLFNG